MTDSHTHLYMPEFEADGPDGCDAAVRRAVEAGVDTMVFPNVDLTTVAPMRALAARFPRHVHMAMGLHPTEIRADYLDALAAIESELRRNRRDYVAVGEVGIDLYWDATFRAEQIDAFRRQCAVARDLVLPVIIHCREGLDDTLSVLADFPDVQAVFHSFGGTVADVERIRALGDYYFGINGIVTFKKSTLPLTLPSIPRDRILLETDSPYLAPVPRRGRRNESAYLPHTAQAVAAALGLTLEEVDAVTTENARRFFKFC